MIQTIAPQDFSQSFEPILELSQRSYFAFIKAMWRAVFSMVLISMSLQSVLGLPINNDGFDEKYPEQLPPAPSSMTPKQQSNYLYNRCMEAFVS